MHYNIKIKRKLKDICDTELAEDLRAMSLQGNNVEDLVTSYNLGLRKSWTNIHHLRNKDYVNVIHNLGLLTN